MADLSRAPGSRRAESTSGRVKLSAQSGHAVLTDAQDGRELDPSALRLPESLVTALDEWARVANTVARAQAGETGDTTARESGSAATLLPRRGRQLAVRLAVETGGEVSYVDPVSGQLERIGRQRTAYTSVARPSLPPRTPWATGLTVSAIVGTLVLVTLVIVTSGLAVSSVILAVLVNLAIAVGFAPSIWLGRRVPVWRWVALGTAGGIVLAWFALLLGLLG